jgi:hypothetical protein
MEKYISKHFSRPDGLHLSLGFYGKDQRHAMLMPSGERLTMNDVYEVLAKEELELRDLDFEPIMKLIPYQTLESFFRDLVQRNKALTEMDKRAMIRAMEQFSFQKYKIAEVLMDQVLLHQQTALSRAMKHNLEESYKKFVGKLQRFMSNYWNDFATYTRLLDNMMDLMYRQNFTLSDMYKELWGNVDESLLETIHLNEMTYIEQCLMNFILASLQNERYVNWNTRSQFYIEPTANYYVGIENRYDVNYALLGPLRFKMGDIRAFSFYDMFTFINEFGIVAHPADYKQFMSDIREDMFEYETLISVPAEINRCRSRENEAREARNQALAARKKTFETFFGMFNRHVKDVLRAVAAGA